MDHLAVEELDPRYCAPVVASEAEAVGLLMTAVPCVFSIKPLCVFASELSTVVAVALRCLHAAGPALEHHVDSPTVPWGFV